MANDIKSVKTSEKIVKTSEESQLYFKIFFYCNFKYLYEFYRIVRSFTIILFQ